MSRDARTSDIAARMWAERRRRKWSAEDLSAQLRKVGVDLPRAVIANLENHRRDYVAVHEIVGLAQVFNTTVTWMVWGTGTACLACSDKPPAGFTCNDCGKSTSTRVADVLDQTVFFRSYVQAVAA